MTAPGEGDAHLGFDFEVPRGQSQPQQDFEPGEAESALGIRAGNPPDATGGGSSSGWSPDGEWGNAAGHAAGCR